MKIDNILLKIYLKIKGISKKIFGYNNKATNLMSIFVAFLMALHYYFYIADLGINKVITLTLLTGILYIVVRLGIYILKRLVFLISRFNKNNLVFFVIFTIAFVKIIDEAGGEDFLEKYQIYLMSLGLTIIIMTFFKSLNSLLKNKKKASIIFLLASAIPLVLLSIFLFSPGESDELEKFNIDNSAKKDFHKKIIYTSKSLEYESSDKDSVSLMSLVNYSGRTKKVRDKYFKKSLAEVSKKGKIWYPEGEKSCPVVFFIHGNHRFTKENYQGYDYLGRYFARRGIVFVSVDENMLNGFYKFGLGNENDARAILLLENISYLLEKNKDKNSELYGLIDENNIGIAGHSRGGEAVAIAQVFNKLKYNPDNGKELDYNFNIKAVASVSATVDQYNFSDKDLSMSDVNYLCIHGSNDYDVEDFSAMKIYDNLNFSKDSDYFKAAIYIGFANHGQFNQLWGRADADPFYGLFVNKKALIKEKDQEEIASLLLYSFMQDSFGLKDNRDIFKNLRNYKLPDTVYYSRYADSSFEPICDFEEDVRLETFKYGKTRFNGFSSINEKSAAVGGKYLSTGLNIDINKLSNYELIFDQNISAKNYLQFDIMEENDIDNFFDTKIQVKIEDENGNQAVIDANKYFDLYPSIKVEHSKLEQINKDYEYKSSYQTVRLPLSEIKNANLDKDNIKYISFIFDSEDADLLIDNIGYSN